MRKIWQFVSPIILTASFSLIIISCTIPSVSYDKKINLYNATLWQMSAERRAGLLSQFANATHRFQEVINHEENRDFLDLSSVQVTWTNDQKYQVQTIKYQKPENGRFIPAVVVDLDETFIDNTMYEIFLALNNQDFSHQTWHQWVKAESAPIYDGVLEFVKSVWSQGGIILLTSNRNQGIKGGNGEGDELIATRNNLIKYGYPAELLDSPFWWMRGAMSYDNNNELGKIANKEARYNYINNLSTTLSPKTPKELGLNETIKPFDSQHMQSFNKMPVQIVMRMGDDINDFNDNFTKRQNHDIKNEFLNDQDIRNLFIKPSPRISFTINQNQEITKTYFTKSLAKKVSKYLQNKKYITQIEYNELKIEDKIFNPHEIYILISGNSMYGGWTNKYADNLKMMEDNLWKYYLQNNGQQIFN